LFSVILVTTKDALEAKKIAKILIEEKLAACVNIVPKIESIYSWEDKIVEDNESLMIIKTKQTLFEKLAQKIKEIHSYSVPEIIALPIEAGSAEYLNWLKDNTIN